MTSDQLLDALQAQRLLQPDAVARVKREVIVSGRPAESIVHEQHLVDEEALTNLKSQILKVPYKKIDFATFDEKLIPLIPEETARTYGVVPISKKDNVLVAGMLNPDDVKAQEALKFIAHRERLSVGIVLISFTDWQAMLRKYSPYKSDIEAAVQSLSLKTGGSAQKVVSLEQGGAVGSEDAPVIRIVADTLREAVQTKASDIHIEPQEHYVRVRLRVDGDLREVATLPVELAQAVVSRVKILSNLKIDETRIPQDGRFRSRILEREIDFRISTFPTPSGEKVAIRILDPSTGLKSFEQLGLTGLNLERVNTGLEKPYGMVLVTGPTGSGKTTTLYAMLQTLNKEDVNVLSLEDPVEYFVSGVNQSQVRPEIGYDFASGLRQILRQDPDIVMVGEIRDEETAGLAVNAALTGHIMLSTLHTNNAAGVIPRLIDMKVEPFLLPSVLNLMIAQRLVGMLCPDCKQPVEAAKPLQDIIAKAIADLPKEVVSSFPAPYKVFKAQGCTTCKGRGVVGRIALFEVIHMTPTLEDVINTGPTVQKIVHEAKKQGMITMRQDGVLKALSGIVSIEEVVRETEEV